MSEVKFRFYYLSGHLFTNLFYEWEIISFLRIHLSLVIHASVLLGLSDIVYFISENVSPLSHVDLMSDFFYFDLFRKFLQQAHVTERDVNSACEILAMGSEFSQMHNSDYTRGLFLLSKCMVSFRCPVLRCLSVALNCFHYSQI